MLRPPATMGGDGLVSVPPTAAAVDPYTTLAAVDYRSATNEDLADLGNGTITRPWGADGADLSVVISDASNGGAEITDAGLVPDRTDSAGASPSVSLDLDGLLDEDDSGVRIVVQIAASKTFDADDDRLLLWLADKAATISSPGRALFVGYTRHGASDYGTRSARYNDGNWTSNYDVTSAGADARAHIEIRSTPKGWRVYYAKGEADGLPARSAMTAARTYGFLDGGEADGAIELRYVRLMLSSGGTSLAQAAIERVWVLKGAL